MSTSSDHRSLRDHPKRTRPRPEQADRPASASGKLPRAPKDDAPLIPERSRDETDAGWNDGPDSNDERLRRDVPPHW
jgi:hypothetical protein